MHIQYASVALCITAGIWCVCGCVINWNIGHIDKHTTTATNWSSWG